MLPDHSDIRPGDRTPFHHDGGDIGVLVSHGFTGSPSSMRPWADHLAAQGYTVRLPLLPGHGLTWQDLNETGFDDWYAAIEAAYAELAARCQTVFAAGLSMGACLVTRLAELHPAVAGLVLVNPAYGTRRFDAKFAPLLKHVIKSRPSIGSDIKRPGVLEPSYDRTPVAAFASLQEGWKTVIADMGAITAPILMYRSREDHVVDSLSGEILRTHATATTVTEVILENSYHVATLDYDAPQIFEGSVEFIRSHSADPVQAP